MGLAISRTDCCKVSRDSFLGAPSLLSKTALQAQSPKMPPPPHIKPENVLKRAQELIAVDQSQAALNVLHEHVTSKRTRNSPIASLEPVMLLFVELCVDLRKGKSAKDGLYQYKNIAQNTNVGTIELVLKKFIELAEARVQEAQVKADQVQSNLDSAAAQTVSNLDDD